MKFREWSLYVCFGLFGKSKIIDCLGVDVSSLFYFIDHMGPIIIIVIVVVPW